MAPRFLNSCTPCAHPADITRVKTRKMETVMRRETELTIEEVVKFLEIDSITAIAVPPAHPEGGDIYLFNPEKQVNAGK